MNKLSKRQIIWDKSYGLCWYCGCELKKGWHVDHVKPVERIYRTGKFHHPENHNIDNMVPTCPPCNRFKMVWSVDRFREELEQQVVRARKTSVNFRMAEKFKLINVNKSKVKFWYEGLKK